MSAPQDPADDGPTAVAALSDDELRRELAGLKSAQAQVESGGTPQQRTEHAGRTEVLEAEFLRRFGTD